MTSGPDRSIAPRAVEPSFRLLIVEDDPDLRRGLVDLLIARNYQVDSVERGDVALEEARRGAHDLILLDAMLPGLSGFDVLRELRGADVRTPVIMLTSRSQEVDRVLGFDLGVDDYVTKPFSLLELMGRIQAVLRRVGSRPGGGADCLVFGQTTIDLQRYVVRRAGQAIPLPSRAIDILKVLHGNQGKVLTRDALMDEVWGTDACPSQRTLANLIVKLRHAIEADPDEPVFLRTVHGVGYRLDLP
jgi:DNA-binding response OmpR family regulator